MVRKVYYQLGSLKLGSLFLLLALMNIGTKQGWVTVDKGEDCGGGAVVPRLVPTVPDVTFDEGADGLFTATFDELANWTISGGGNPNFSWAPSTAESTSAVPITVSLRGDAQILKGPIDRSSVCGKAKVCATAIGSDIEACGWNRACANLARLRGLGGKESDRTTFAEGFSIDVTFSLVDPIQGRVWEVTGHESAAMLEVKDLTFQDGEGSFNVAADPNLAPCASALRKEYNLPVALYLRSGELEIKRVVLVTLVRRG